MLDVENAKWVSLVLEQNQGGTSQSPACVVNSWTNINMNDAQDLLNKAASTSPLGDRQKEQVEENRKRLHEVIDLIHKLKRDLFSNQTQQEPQPGTLHGGIPMPKE